MCMYIHYSNNLHRLYSFPRHQGILPDTEVTFSVKNDEANKLRYHMSLGKTHQVTGLCTNKREGKHLASQALIKVEE